MSDSLSQQLIQSRLTTISTLKALADKIDKIDKDSKIALLSGTSVSIIGTVVGVPIGITAMVLTGGIALPIAAGVVAAVGASGGVTSFAASLGGYLHIKSKYKRALAAIKADIDLGEKVVKCWNITREVIAGIGAVAFVINQSADIAKVVLKAGESTLDGTAAAVRTASIIRTVKVGQVVGGVSLAVSTILLPFDIITLVKTSRYIHHGKSHEKAKELRRLADELERDMEEMKLFFSYFSSEESSQ